jgi:hypothetical protein
MPGASDETHRVEILNANWSPDEAGGDGQFATLIVTEETNATACRLAHRP